MSKVVIKVENLAKQYRLGSIGQGYLKDDITRYLAKLRGKEDPFLKIGEVNDRTSKGSSDYVWAIRDVNFEVRQGEVLGIIGKNGAGKSTLLKILSKVTKPTEGQIKLKGRIASLLEVGTGFHPELTGRENIFLNGAILGMTRNEIKAKFDEIVDFSGVERYIDTPVKRYSSGMYVRLAFAVAAFLEPEILIIDEVLAVGDAEFQKKCLGKMKDVSDKDGRTVLFVSHNMSAVSSLCSRVIMMKNGTVLEGGSKASIIERYLNDDADISTINHRWQGSAGDDSIRLLRTWIVNEFDEEPKKTSDELTVGFEIEIQQELEGLIAGFKLFSEFGAPLLYAYYDDMETPPTSTVSPSKMKAVFKIPRNTLSHGVYRISFEIGIHNRKGVIHHDHGNLTISLDNVDGIGRRFIQGSAEGFKSILRSELTERSYSFF